MREFLEPSVYCDSNHPLLHEVLAHTAPDAETDIELAVRLFGFVRDEVRYTFCPWAERASSTLTRRRGVCTNKSNLLVALLRAAGIPAAYGVLRVNPQEYFGSIAPPYLKPLVSNHSVHVYAAAFLAGRWVRCDPSTDRDLSLKTGHLCRQTRLIEWDGVQDALDFLQPQHVYRDLGLRGCIDDLLDVPPRHAQPETLAAINRYLAFIRNSPRFETAEELVRTYRKTAFPKSHDELSEQ